MNIVVVGHVDHGKSTVIGRLLADTHSLPEGKLEQIKHMCELNSKPFEFAFLLDALKDERSQGITIDSARVFFKTKKRDYIIIDAPGHVEFLKNMISGAARAEAALLVIDAREGIRENTRRHAYMLSMLGIKQVAVLVNKMDLVKYDEQTFFAIQRDYSKFLSEINVRPNAFLPVSGMDGENIVGLNGSMPWYKGLTVLETLESFGKESVAMMKPLRMFVQDVYKFTALGDTRRIVAGTIGSGVLMVGDQVMFFPSGKKTTVNSIESFNEPSKSDAIAGDAIGFTMEEQVYVPRGELVASATQKLPHVSKRIRVSLFWLGKNPFVTRKDYLLKIGTSKTTANLEHIERVINASTLESTVDAECINRHEVAECTLRLSKQIAFDTIEDNPSTSRFVIVDGFEIAGGGTIKEVLPDRLTWVRDKVVMRDFKWEKSAISDEQRADKYNQKSCLILITGQRGAGRKEVARELEAQLFESGKVVYFLGIGNVLYGIDADIKTRDGNKEEHLRRLSEVAHILLDAGVILIVTAMELTQDDLEIIKTIVDPEKIEVAWVGESVSTDLSYNLKVPGRIDINVSVKMLKESMQEKGFIFKPW